VASECTEDERFVVRKVYVLLVTLWAELPITIKTAEDQATGEISQKAVDFGIIVRRHQQMSPDA